ncbi:MAG: hemolysin family protein [Myxococcales bacterium]
MTAAWWVGVGGALLLVLLNGFFVATEFALVKVRPTQLDALAAGGSKAASRARQLVDKLDEYLSATQLGITLASLGLGWIGEPAFARLIEPAARRFGLSETAVDATGGAIAFLIITFLHIVFGELAPKSLAIQRAEGTSLAVSAPMKLFYAVFYPAIWALNGLAGSVLRLVRLPPVSESEKAHTEEELRMIFASMRGRTGLSRERLDILERTLRLPSKTARDLMVSRGEMAAFRLDQTDDERREIVRRTGHSRYPVVDGDVDHVIGVLNLRDVFLAGGSAQANAGIKALLREPMFVPESISAEALLREFRRRRQRLAIVVDEYGGTAGVVSVEDVVAAVVGEVADEYATGGPAIEQLQGGRFAIDPRTPVDQLAEHFALRFEAGDAATAAGLVMSQLGRIPVAGDSVRLSNLELTVEEMSGPRIVRLTARVTGPDT